MKFIRPLKQSEKDLLKKFVSGGTRQHNSEWFKGFGVYFDGKYYWWVTCWGVEGTRSYFKGLKA